MYPLRLLRHRRPQGRALDLRGDGLPAAARGPCPTAPEADAFARELAQRDLADATAEAGSRRRSAVTGSPMDVVRTVASMIVVRPACRAGATDRAAGLRCSDPLDRAGCRPRSARHHRLRQGLEPVEPDGYSLTYSENFLTMLSGEARLSARAARIFDIAMILHAEHEMNTFSRRSPARVVAGTGADLDRGSRCGDRRTEWAAARRRQCCRDGAVRTVGERRPRARRRARRCSSARRSCTASVIRCTGAYDPRATILKRSLEGTGPRTAARPTGTRSPSPPSGTVFEEKGLYPNVDLYSASVYRYLGVYPNDQFYGVVRGEQDCRQGRARARSSRRDNRDHPTVGHVRRSNPRRSLPQLGR